MLRSIILLLIKQFSPMTGPYTRRKNGPRVIWHVLNFSSLPFFVALLTMCSQATFSKCLLPSLGYVGFSQTPSWPNSWVRVYMGLVLVLLGLTGPLSPPTLEAHLQAHGLPLPMSPLDFSLSCMSWLPYVIGLMSTKPKPFQYFRTNSSHQMVKNTTLHLLLTPISTLT